MSLKRFAYCLLWWSLVGLAFAEPQVLGYERYHAKEPGAEGGAVLFSELGCINCHGGSTPVIPRKGPWLIDLAQRLNRDWVEEFLKEPSHGRAGTTMPSMFDRLPESERDEAIADVVAWLGEQKSTMKLKASRHVNAERGSALYHELGCVACHAPTPDYIPGRGENSPHAVALPDFAAKTDLVALTHFVGNVSRYRSDGRMPHIEVDPQEANDLAAHLLDYQASDPRAATRVSKWPTVSTESIASGAAWVKKLNCAACHDLPGIKPAPVLPISGGATKSDGHCFSKQARAGLPQYKLREDQQSALSSYLESSDSKPLGREAGLAAMNCYACHDPTPDVAPLFVGDKSLGDSGRLPPPLTGVGHKLKREWLESVFVGNGAGRVRPYVKTRMPAYSKHASKLADWLEDHDHQAQTTQIAVVDHSAGKKLLGTQGGVGCITCHQWGEKRSLGVQAMDISALDQRLRPSWFRTYLLNPGGYRTGTLMPPLWPGGKSSLPEILDGDSERQIGAIWSFIRDSDEFPEGFPDRGSGEFELVPKDRPIVQRTFLAGVGTKAILVGFPAGIHFAYDGEKGTPALIWRGRFFDAYNTWFTRGAPFERPLESSAPFEASETVNGRFLGYELDPKGNPTFLTRRGEQNVSEHFSATQNTLIRTVHWDDGRAPALTHPTGLNLRTESSAQTLTITYSWK